MQLNGDQQKALAKIIVEHAPQSILREAAQALRVLPDFDTLLKSGPSLPDERALYIAERLVGACCAGDRAGDLISTLRRHLYANEAFLGEINSFEIAATQDSAQQGRLAIRANMLSLRGLGKFVNVVEGQVCLIASIVPTAGGSTVSKLGTGFLVGPDLVLTAYHTLREKITNGQALPGSETTLFAFFDFCEGERMEDPLVDIDGVKRVAFAADWLKCSSPDFDKDGLLDPASEEANKDALGKHLDHVLVRLAEPIGAQTRRVGGGERRGWIDIRTGGVPLAQDDQIIIPQHPNGKAQKLALGRYQSSYSKLDLSGTRFRYSAETDEGTSGAPCFNHRFIAVGMHNAAYKPHGDPKGKTIANQGISIGKIADCLPALEGNKPATTEASWLWKVGSNGDMPRVILSRQTFMDWIRRAARDDVTTLDDRVHVALGAGRNIGKTFSFEILQAARAGKSEPIVLLGTQSELIPTRGMDLVSAVATQLGISKAELSTMPERPGSASEGEARSADRDKLNKWKSDELPRWFNEVLRKHRTQEVDLTAEAKQQLAALKAAGLPVSPDIMERANSPKPIMGPRQRWAIAWIVFDGLDDVKFTPEVADVIAGLIGTHLAAGSVPAELRRLRWAFLGDNPAFANGLSAKPEKLDPMEIKAEHWVESMKIYANSVALIIPEELELILMAMVESVENGQDFTNAAKRLLAYQAFFGDVQKRIAGRLKRVS